MKGEHVCNAIAAVYVTLAFVSAVGVAIMLTELVIKELAK